MQNYTVKNVATPFDDSDDLLSVDGIRETLLIVHGLELFPILLIIPKKETLSFGQKYDANMGM